jgi:hypothetical protein
MLSLPGAERRRPKVAMDRETSAFKARDTVPDREQKRMALTYLGEAWAEARHDGVDDDCMAQACLFAAFAELVATYGEEAAAEYAERLAAKVRNGEYSLELARQ